MKKYTIACILLISIFNSNAQTNSAPCTLPEAEQFDFWVGNWNLYSADTLTGNNLIQKIMNGCAVQENFKSTGNNYIGSSWSMFNSALGKWQQTWIDNQGAFIYLTGNYSDGTMLLRTEPRKLQNGKELINRMRYHNIQANSFDWNWESSTDQGKTWITSWHIHYVRK